uniref:Uncharacterized protein n=1 Tax=Biomphalaria glabrata TaxID=6526 RepID=A0A2C9JIU2_BIOGL
MKTLLVASLALCILPAAFAGDFKEMFAEFEKLKHKVPAASERNFDIRTHRFRNWEDKQEDSRANGEVDLLVDKVRMKTILTEKLEKLTNDYERQRIQFISQTTWRFLKLCPGANNAADLLERLDDETFLEPSNTLNQVTNWTPNITVNTSDAHNQVR